jgi:hypothetical protein
MRLDSQCGFYSEIRCKNRQTSLRFRGISFDETTVFSNAAQAPPGKGGTMRIRTMTIYAFVVAVLVMPVSAADLPEELRDCQLGTKWDIYVNYAGPVNCNQAAMGYFSIEEDGECTGVRYQVLSGPTIAQAGALVYNPEYLDYLYSGISTDPYVGPSSSNAIAAPCEGDSSLQMGEGVCHQQAVRFNPNDVANGEFWVAVPGLRELTVTTLSAKGNGPKIERCQTVGVGDLMEVEDSEVALCVASCGNFDPNQTITKTEILDFKGCKAKFEFNLATGEVVDFGLAPAQCSDSTCCQDNPLDPYCCTPGTPDCCKEVDFFTTQLTLEAQGVPGFDPKDATFGDGLINIGPDSCSCRVIGGRVYCWGKNCPN